MPQAEREGKELCPGDRVETAETKKRIERSGMSQHRAELNIELNIDLNKELNIARRSSDFPPVTSFFAARY
jgi:hypothetical protein